MHERQSPAEATCGFPGLLKGTQLLGCALITDRGFCRDLAAKYAKAGILSPREWCEANNVLFLWPFTDDDDVGLVYDPTTHSLNIVPKEDAKVRVMSILIHWLLHPSPFHRTCSQSCIPSAGPCSQLVPVRDLPTGGRGAVPRRPLEDLAWPSEEAPHPHERCGDAQNPEVLQLVRLLHFSFVTELTDLVQLARRGGHGVGGGAG